MILIMARKALLLISLFFTTGMCLAQKKSAVRKPVKKTAKARQKPVAEKTMEYNGNDKRKIKYLCYDDVYITVFFDNGKAALTNEFTFCEENLPNLFSLPLTHSYEVIKFLGEPTMTVWPDGVKNEAPSGIKLSKEWWYIKDFKKVKEIKKCN